MVFDFLDTATIITEIIIVTAGSVATGIWMYFRHVAKRDGELCRRLDQQDKDITELKNDIKLIIKWARVFSQLTDEQTARAHPDEMQRLRSITKDMLNGESE